MAGFRIGTFLVSIIFSLGFTTAIAQIEELPQKIVYDQEVIDLMNQAKAEMKAENYEAANRTFRKALATRKILPTDLSYLFAETLYVVHQYQNSLNFVDKYLSLAGQGGNYYDKAIELKQLLQEEFKRIKECSYCNLSGYRYVTCYNCQGVGTTTELCYNCKGSGKTVCPKCMGQGVYITFNSFSGKQYQECDVCNGKGYVVCNVCEGKKELTGTCSVCLGTGKIASSIICNHKAEQELEEHSH